MMTARFFGLSNAATSIVSFFESVQYNRREIQSTATPSGDSMSAETKSIMYKFKFNTNTNHTNETKAYLLWWMAVYPFHRIWCCRCSSMKYRSNKYGRVSNPYQYRWPSNRDKNQIFSETKNPIHRQSTYASHWYWNALSSGEWYFDNSQTLAQHQKSSSLSYWLFAVRSVANESWKLEITKLPDQLLTDLRSFKSCSYRDCTSIYSQVALTHNWHSNDTSTGNWHNFRPAHNRCHRHDSPECICIHTSPTLHSADIAHSDRNCSECCTLAVSWRIAEYHRPYTPSDTNNMKHFPRCPIGRRHLQHKMFHRNSRSARNCNHIERMSKVKWIITTLVSYKSEISRSNPSWHTHTPSSHNEFCVQSSFCTHSGAKWHTRPSPS